jgi:hypothetical protein
MARFLKQNLYAFAKLYQHFNVIESMSREASASSSASSGLPVIFASQIEPYLSIA